MSYIIHSKDYKKSAIEYYLVNRSLRETCKIFKCKKSTLFDWITKDINKNKQILKYKKYDNKIDKFIIKYATKNVTPTLKQIS